MHYFPVLQLYIYWLNSSRTWNYYIIWLLHISSSLSDAYPAKRLVQLSNLIGQAIVEYIQTMATITVKVETSYFVQHLPTWSRESVPGIPSQIKIIYLLKINYYISRLKRKMRLDLIKWCTSTQVIFYIFNYVLSTAENKNKSRDLSPLLLFSAKLSGLHTLIN